MYRYYSVSNNGFKEIVPLLEEDEKIIMSLFDRNSPSTSESERLIEKHQELSESINKILDMATCIHQFTEEESDYIDSVISANEMFKKAFCHTYYSCDELKDIKKIVPKELNKIEDLPEQTINGKSNLVVR